MTWQEEREAVFLAGVVTFKPVLEISPGLLNTFSTFKQDNTKQTSAARLKRE